MENRKDILIRVLFGLIVLCVLIIVAIRKPNDMIPPPLTNNICKEDSLREVINDLQSELDIAEDGWDKKEQRYEDILFEYEYGIDYLKHNHTNAYRDFHRIIGYKERYSREVEFDNKKRLESFND